METNRNTNSIEINGNIVRHENVKVAESMMRFLKYNLPPEINDLALVSLDHFSKIDLDLIKQHGEKPIILFGFQEITSPKLESKLISLQPYLKQGNIGFLRLPEMTQDNSITTKYLELKQKKSNLNELLPDLEGKAKRDTANQLLHDLRPDKNEKIYQKALEDARLIMDIDEKDQIDIPEIIKRLEILKQEGQTQIELSKKITEGVYCDVSGTLLIGEKEEELNLVVVEMLKLLEQQGHKITIWTGGNVEEYEKILRSKNINWTIRSKSDFTGQRVQYAIDNQSREVLKDEYQIYTEKFIRIKNKE
mgnify:CR=1 FL=1